MIAIGYYLQDIEGEAMKFGTIVMGWTNHLQVMWRRATNPVSNVMGLTIIYMSWGDETKTLVRNDEKLSLNI